VRRVAALLLAGAVTAAGCSDDDAQSSNTTAASTPEITQTTVEATTSTAATTAPTTAPPTTDTPTTPEPTTQPVDEEALKARIAKDYERAFYRGYRMLARPSLRNLEALAATVVAVGSPAYHNFVARIRDLVALGDAVVPNDPDLLSATVEKVKLVGALPYRRAVVTVCEVTNRKQVTPPENSPTGEQIEVAGSGQLLVFRFEEPVRFTSNGWLRTRGDRKGVQFTGGQTTCQPA
jgi:hypothetical protein